jgi:DNA-binding transcriptional regulator LsrR (DeoR family)
MISTSDDGRKVDHVINHRIVGTDIESIRRIRRVIGVAGGTKKVQAIRAAVRGAGSTFL